MYQRSNKNTCMHKTPRVQRDKCIQKKMEYSLLLLELSLMSIINNQSSSLLFQSLEESPFVRFGGGTNNIFRLRGEIPRFFILELKILRLATTNQQGATFGSRFL